MDEWRNLTIPLVAKNIQELFILRSYESHPLLYYIFMYMAKCTTFGYVAMFTMHFLAAVGTIYLLVFKSPFSKITLTFLLGSYYFLYETMVFNRQYVFIIFFIFLILFLIQSKKNHWLFLLAAILFSQLHVYCWLIIIPLSIYYYIFLQNAKYKYLCIFLVISSCLLAYVTAKPPIDSSNSFSLKAINVGNVLLYLRYFIQGFSIHLNSFHPFTNYITDAKHPYNATAIFGSNIETLIASLFLLIASTLSIKNNQIKILYLTIFFALSFFNFNYQSCALRHVSFYFFGYIICLWLSNSKSNWFLYIVLIYQVGFGIKAYALDYKYAYSQSKNLANYIQQNYKSLPVIGYYIFAIDAPSGYLNKAIFSLHNLKWHRYYNQQQKETTCEHCTNKEILTRLKTTRNNLGPSLLILTKGTSEQWLSNYLKTDTASATFLSNFEPAIERNEEYDLFLIK